LVLVIACLAGNPATAEEPKRADLVLVKGAGGEQQYDAAFGQWVRMWTEAAPRASMTVHSIGIDQSDRADRELLQQTLARMASDKQRPLWLVLIGHGTFFQDQAKFNLSGPDISARELAQWLRPLERPVAIVNCSSCSGTFIDSLSGPNRVVITATRSGVEQNYARFGQFLAESIQQTTADIDHDGAISLLEAFLTASRKTQAFYSNAGRLATEHALLDDNGDKTGSSADFFRGIRVTRRSEGNVAVDGLRSHQWMLSQLSEEPPLSAEKLKQRDQLEAAIEVLRGRKSTMDEADYYGQLETYLVQIARLHEESDASTDQ
jgi:hypothetical protein